MSLGMPVPRPYGCVHPGILVWDGNGQLQGAASHGVGTRDGPSPTPATASHPNAKKEK